MGVYHQKPNGRWGPAIPGWHGKDYDLEVYKDGRWYLYWNWNGQKITKGYSRTRLGRSIRIYFAILWFHIKGIFGKSG